MELNNSTYSNIIKETIYQFVFLIILEYVATII